jgi:ubiquinone/menaquinone biosynthesis C-methylase UbiE
VASARGSCLLAGDRPRCLCGRTERAAVRAQIEKHNAEIDAKIAELNKRLAELRRPYEAKLGDEKLAAIPEPIRADTKAAIEMPPDKRNEIQEYLASKFEASLKVKPEEVNAALGDADKATSSQIGGAIESLNGQRRSFGRIEALVDVGSPPPTYLLRRGNYETPGPEVEPGVLSSRSEQPLWPASHHRNSSNSLMLIRSCARRSLAHAVCFSFSSMKIGSNTAGSSRPALTWASAWTKRARFARHHPVARPRVARLVQWRTILASRRSWRQYSGRGRAPHRKGPESYSLSRRASAGVTLMNFLTCVRHSLITALAVLASAAFLAQAQEKSVRRGINDPFLDPNVGEFVEKFEREGREIFDKREEIVAACGIKPGMAVADVGAGTGLFTRLFAPLVGEKGRVYAVDIAKKFIDHIEAASKKLGLKNVVCVECTETSAELPPDSIDLAFICDTYHHFEFPHKTMRSIHRALRPGGQVVLVEFARVEGVSSEWVMNHVRAGQETFTREIVAAGFKLGEEKKFLEESYFVRFEKVEDAQPSNTLEGKKLIEWGWDEPDTKFMRENIERMEQFPFDGLVFHVTSSKGGNFTWEMWGPRRFDVAEFEHAIDDLKATLFRRFTDRFLRMNVTPGSVDWFDDEAWQTVEHNFAVAALLARQSGSKGFMFDVEQYQSALFDYRQQKHHETKPFADYQAMVRQRGAAWIRAVNEQFPDITILLTFGYRLAQPQGEQKDRSESHYGLLADFLDGVLDACSEVTRIIDAWEYSYPYKRPEQFEEAYETIRTKSLDWTEVPEKYRGQVTAGFGVWMDHDWRRTGWDLSDFTKNHFTPAELEAAVRAALLASDEYVWIYTEQPRWWTNERLPQAYVDALKAARQPER